MSAGWVLPVCCLLSLILQPALSKSCSFPGLSNSVTSCPDEIADTLLAIQDHVYNTNSQMEIVLAIDEGGLKPEQHYWAKQLLLILSEIFVVAPKHTLVSVVTYGTSARTIISMASQADMCSLSRNITSMSFLSGESYLNLGVKAAIKEFNSSTRPSTTVKVTFVLTTANWRNLGADPEMTIKELKTSMNQTDSYLAVVVLRSPDDKVGLISDVISEFASSFQNRKLAYKVDLSAEYLRELHQLVESNKAMGPYWPLQLEVDKSKCAADGRVCASDELCICDVRTVLDEYICISNKDMDPPEAVVCEAPKGPLRVPAGDNSTIVTWSPPIFSDNSDTLLSVNANKIPGLYQAGVYHVQTNATDRSGNTATCSFSFTVTS